MKISLIIFLVSFYSIIYAQYPSNFIEVPVVILLGQSNAEGVGYVDTLSTIGASKYLGLQQFKEFHNANYQIRNYTTGQVNFRATVNGRFGLELSLLDTLKSSFEDLHLFKVAVSGRALCSDRVAIPTDWNPTVYDKNDLFFSFEQEWMHFLSNLYRQGKKPKVLMIVWYQGEADTGDSICANEYSANFEILMNKIYNILKDRPKLYMCEIRYLSLYTLINSTFTNYAASNNNAIFFPTVGLFDREWLDDGTRGQTHLSTKGYLDLGIAIAINYLNSQNRLQTNY